MSDKYSKVYALNEPELINIEPSFVYLTVPAEWVCVYHKILAAVADLGKNILDDCNSTCKGTNKTIINCWNMFQSAVACNELDRREEAEFLINYIKKQLESIYRGSGKSVFDGTFPISISEDGKLKAVVTCNDSMHKFEVDPKTGKLYEAYIDCKENNQVFVLEDNNFKGIEYER